MIEYLTIDQVIEIHDEMITRYGGLPGIRNRNLLLSAMEAPKASAFGEEMYPSAYEKAAVYLYHIVCNHPFNDANKRTGYATALVFLEANGFPLLCQPTKLEDLVVEVAKGKKAKEHVVTLLTPLRA